MVLNVIFLKMSHNMICVNLLKKSKNLKDLFCKIRHDLCGNM